MMILKSIFSKMQIMKILFPCSGIGARMKSSVAMLKPVKVMMNMRNAREVNPNKAGLFEGSFSWRVVNLTPTFIFQEEFI